MLVKVWRHANSKNVYFGVWGYNLQISPRVWLVLFRDKFCHFHFIVSPPLFFSKKFHIRKIGSFFLGIVKVHILTEAQNSYLSRDHVSVFFTQVVFICSSLLSSRVLRTWRVCFILKNVWARRRFRLWWWSEYSYLFYKLSNLFPAVIYNLQRSVLCSQVIMRRLLMEAPRCHVRGTSLQIRNFDGWLNSMLIYIFKVQYAWYLEGTLVNWVLIIR